MSNEINFEFNKSIEVGENVEIFLRESNLVVYGKVKKILTKNLNHPYGIKVLLESGEIGRIQNYSKLQEKSIITFKGQKKEKPKSFIDDKNRVAYPRDATVAMNAVIIADYQCEIDKYHPSFIRRTTGKNYTESHHLIPMNAQDDFDYSLDVEENVVSLCSNCHNCLHYGADDYRNEYLYKLFEERKDMLKQVGLDIEIDRLKQYYQIEE